MSVEDIVSHLYVSEAYYFNPKQVKRQQLVKLVTMLQNSVVTQKPQQRGKNFFERKRFLNYGQQQEESDDQHSA